ncbi:hypothetical protein HGRIS_011150 [Hohenbuehelia grisea]|uniref:Flavin-containing monooxygenase n=1 Tax=Hohenbuehelia grisea TaxID=104357 RepID=A0ABR3IYZ2_9AGAR
MFSIQFTLQMPHSSLIMNNCNDIASSWLRDFSNSLVSAEVDAVASSFHPDGWFRDLLVFTWDNRSLEGHDNIRKYLADTLARAKITDVTLEERPHLKPVFGNVTPRHQGVEAGFTFQSNIALGEGFFRLTQNEESGEWKALSVYMAVRDLKGHEELGPESGVYGGHTIPWDQVWRERCAYAEKNVDVLIIGAGQTGLNIGARFKQMGLQTIIVEKNRRVGDVWRKRYPTLTLHTPRTQHPMLYQPFPKNWPMFTPRDKLANWFEQYAQSQDLMVWTNSRPLPVPAYDQESKRWSVSIDRDGTIVELRPSHIIVACGTLGSPQVPRIPNSNEFAGSIIHTGSFNGAAPFTGKRVIVVGAGNTSADVCQDLVTHNAAEVTVVQRSSSCVISVNTVKDRLLAMWPEGVPTEISDFKSASMPFGLLKKIFIDGADDAWALEKEMHDGLRKAGLQLNMGPSGAGQLTLVYERLGGYWLDVGCAKLIAGGQVKVKQGVEVDHFTKDGVVYTDGSTQEADVVVFATGYRNIREDMKDLFGDEVISKTGEVWGLDSEDEVKGAYRPSGHPGLWFAAGDFFHSRYMSKRTGLEIKAIQLGLRTA